MHKFEWKIRSLGNSGQLSIPADCPMPKPSLVDLYYSKHYILAVPAGYAVNELMIQQAISKKS
jgi:hypothetical protein